MNTHVFHGLQKPPALWEAAAARAPQPLPCSIETVSQVGLQGPAAASSPKACPTLPSFPATFPLLCLRLSNAGDTTTVLQSSPPSRVTPCSSSTSHHTSPRCHLNSALALSRHVGLHCCCAFPRDLPANKVKALGAGAMPPSLHPLYTVQRLARPSLSPAPARVDHILSILP